MEVSSMPEWSLAPVRLVEPDPELDFPRLITPEHAGQAVPDFLRTRRALVELALERSGAALLRGFRVDDEAAFEHAARALCEKLETRYGDLVKRKTADAIYDATWYPSDRAILFHNEGSHTPKLPRRQLFFCAKDGFRGGETPIVDSRKVLQELRPELAGRFARLGLSYVRNFIPGVDVSWQRFFRTEDRAQVERACREQGVQFVWKRDGSLRTTTRTAAVVQHPLHSTKSFCNQILLHHVACLDAKTGAALRAVLDPEDLPRNVLFGDDSPISDEVVAEVLRVTVQAAVRFTWKRGDILLLDNLGVAHARSPFEGERQILVAIGDVISHASLAQRPEAPFGAVASQER